MLLSNDHWYNAYIAIIIVSILPNLLLFFIPFHILKEKTYRGFNVRHIMLCFAAAGLIGDVFLHTIPHLLGAHDHDHSHDGHSHSHTNDKLVHASSHAESAYGMSGMSSSSFSSPESDSRGLSEKVQLEIFKMIGLEKGLLVQLFIISGFLVFFTAEKLATSFSSHSHSHGHSHDHSHDHHSCDESTEDANNTSGKVKPAKQYSTVFHAIYHKLAASGWLNLLADSMHNFTDGIAIGASFASTGHGLGFATFISVVLHEIPHEIGDFTILINNGLSKSEAIKAQFLTAIAAILGTAIGLLAQRNRDVEEIMLAFSSGGFLYIAAVTILPDIVREKSSVLQTLSELVAFAMGIAMMVLVAMYE